MKFKIERRTTVVTSYELDLSSLNIKEFKQALDDSESEWISKQFDDADGLYRILKNNSDIASELFNVLNTNDIGVRDEYFLDGEEYYIEC